MKKVLSTLLLCGSLFLAGVGTAACGSKTTPVYQGMTISKETASSLKKASFKDKYEKGGDNGNHYGHDKHDDEDEDTDIEDIVTIDIEADDEVKYYVKPNETYIIQVHVSNPSDFEIQSFTLNGKKYANYMFKEGSNMELLLLEAQAPSTPGYYDYSIDAIKYIDGTEIKDVDMSKANKKIRAGIAYDSAPTATLVSQNITSTTAEFGVDVDDHYTILDPNETKFYLTDGKEIVDSKPVQNGSNTLKFEGREIGATYHYGVLTAFDLVDGKNMRKEWLLEGDIRTLAAFNLKNIECTKESITFDVEQILESGILKDIALYDFDTEALVERAGIEARRFDGLLSNHHYAIVLDFSYVKNDETIEDWCAFENLKTGEKVAPSVGFVDLHSDKTAIGFDLAQSDEDEVLHLDKMELLKGGEVVRSSENFEELSFTGLEPGTKYTVVVNYSYDLNDGQGKHEEKIEVEYITLVDTIAVDRIINNNSNVIKAGEKMNFRVLFDNPSNIEINTIYINDQPTTVVGGNRITNAIVEFVPEDTGLVEFQVNKVSYTLEGIEATQLTNEPVTVTYPVYTDLKDATFDIVGSDFSEVWWAGPQASYTGQGMIFHFDNELDYEIVSFDDKTDFKKLDKDTYYIPRVGLSKIDFGYPGYGYSTQPFNVFGNNPYQGNFTKGQYSHFGTIETPDDLVNMTADGFYVLANDIDMMDHPVKKTMEFGFLAGCGHKITNLVQAIDQNNKLFNLFSNSAVYDVIFEGLFISISSNGGPGGEEPRPFGNTRFVNCEIEGDVILHNAWMATEFRANNYRESTKFDFRIEMDGNNYHIQSEGIKLPIEDHLKFENGLVLYVYGEHKAVLGCYDTDLTSFVAGDDCFMIGDGAFAACEGIEEFVVNENTVFGKDVLPDKPSLKRGVVQISDLTYEITRQEGGITYFGTRNAFQESSVESITVVGNGAIPSSAFSGCRNLKRVVLGEGITEIGYSAFQNCPALESITLPSTLTDIKSSAFENCSSLKSIDIPDSVQTIDGWTFARCASLEKIALPANLVSIEGGLFDGCSKLKTVTIPENVKAIKESAFSGCESLSSVSLPSALTSIGRSAFWDCKSLASIIIPEGVTSIDNSAFFNCLSLASVTLPSTLTSLGESAFCQCESLTSVSIPKGVSSIGRDAFYRCLALASISIPEGVTSIGNEAFYKCPLSSVALPSTLISIGDRAFSECESLASISIPEGVTTIGESAFGGCSSLASATLPSTLASIPNGLFSNCPALTSVSIPEGITSIGDWAFSGCKLLASASLPSSISSIGSAAFQNCKSLASIAIPEGVTSIGRDTFNNCSALASVALPSTLVSIGEQAFLGCASLTSLSLPDTLTSIGPRAFSGCSSLASISIPETVTMIGENAFGWCKSLTSIVVPGSVKSINESAFQGCEKLKTLILKEGVKTITDEALNTYSSDCTYVIPTSVTSIATEAFSNLEYGTFKICYMGTEEQWQELVSGMAGSLPGYSHVYFYTETEPTEPGNYWHYVEGVPTLW